MTDSATQAAHELRVVVGRLRRRLREVSDAALTPSQSSLLSRLGKDEPVSASDLAVAEGIRPQSVAPTLAALEERGLTQRRPDPVDGRRQLVSLTRGGHALLDDTRRVREEWLARALADRFTEDERRTVISALAMLERLSQP